MMTTAFNTANATWDRGRGIDVGDLEFVTYGFRGGSVRSLVFTVVLFHGVDTHGAGADVEEDIRTP
jgi:hypothetical protein